MAKAKTIDQKGMGFEPTWNDTEVTTASAVIKAFNWYNYFNGYKEAKEYICEYLTKQGQKDVAKLVKKAKDYDVTKSIGWLTRMSHQGYKLQEQEVKAIDTHVEELVAKAKDLIEEKEEAKTVTNKPNVQEIMFERAMEVGGELEGMLDTYIAEGVQAKHKIQPIKNLMQYSLLPQHVKLLIEGWEQHKKEFEELQTTEDKDLLESYSHFSKVQIRYLIKFCELMIHDLEQYITWKKSTRAKPKRKPVPVTKLVEKLKYMTEFKDLDIKSVVPTKIHLAQEMFAYDTAKRKLHYYKADEYSGGLSVKGTTITGFSTADSCMKTLRKPDKQVKEIMKATKPATRKFFKDINAVDIKVTGRFNENIVILKVF